MQRLQYGAGEYLKGCSSFRHHCDNVSIGFKLGGNWSFEFIQTPKPWPLVFFLQISAIFDPVQE